DLLQEDQVESVLGILLVNLVQKDEVVWRGDSFGVYTVKGNSTRSWLLPSGIYGTTGIEFATKASGKQYKRWWKVRLNQLKKAVAGIIIRNEAGLVMGSCVYLWDNVSEQTTTEAIACLRVVNFAEDLGFR
ncbi:hypothetical protein Golax_022989, partial [Gossypium laxum]|nr:hypothetical protein [Gossypium laxum]